MVTVGYLVHAGDLTSAHPMPYGTVRYGTVQYSTVPVRTYPCHGEVLPPSSHPFGTSGTSTGRGVRQFNNPDSSMITFLSELTAMSIFPQHNN